MRLLLLTQDFPPDVGGTQTYAYELALRWAVRCEEFAVVAPDVEGAQELDAQLPFKVVRVAASYDTLSVKAAGPLLRSARLRSFDAVFAVQWPAAVAAVLARRLDGPEHVFVAAHGRELLLNPLPRPLDRLYDWTRRAVLHRAEQLFPVSRYTAGLLHEAGVPQNHTRVAHNGTDPSRFAPRDATSLRDKLSLEEKRVLLTVGRLVPRKGIDTVLRALPQVIERCPDVTYLVAGTGPDRERLERVAQAENVSHQVRFLGRVPYEQLPLYYNASDVFVMPARADEPDVEGFGIVFLEAGACEVPVVGARTGGIPDAIRDRETGRLVPPDAPGALADVLCQLLNHPRRARKLGEQGRQRVLREATWDHTADRIYEAMKKVQQRGFLVE